MIAAMTLLRPHFLRASWQAALRASLIILFVSTLWTTTVLGDGVTSNSLLHYRTFGRGLSQKQPEEVTVNSTAGGDFSFNNILINGGVGINVSAPAPSGGSSSYYTINFPGANHQVQIGSYTGLPGGDFEFRRSATYYYPSVATTNWQILEAIYAPDGTLIQLAANFEWLDDQGQRALQGEVRYHSAYPGRSQVIFDHDSFGANQSANALVLTINRIGDTSVATSVDYHTEDYGAQAGRDYTSVRGTLTWSAGDGASKTIQVPLLQRTASGDRVFFARLEGNATGNLVTAAAIITDEMRVPTASLASPSGAVSTTYPIYLTNSSYVVISQILALADGSVFLAGSFNSVNGQFVPGLVRLNPKGEVDSAFYAKLPIAYSASRLALQRDGKLIVGSTLENARVVTSPLVRLNPDGSLDTSFQPPSLNGVILDLAIQPDDRLVVSGSFQEGNGLLRMNVDGSIDPSFVRPSINVTAMYGFSLLQPDGKLLVSDTFDNVRRLNPDASVDNTFQLIELGANQRANTVALQPDGKLLALTYYLETKLGRFNHDGSPDPGFSFDCTTVSRNATISAVALQSDGKVVVGLKMAPYGEAPTTGLVRLNTDGTLDPTFQAGPELPLSIGALALKADGTLFVSGGYYSTSGQNVVHTVFTRLDAYPGGVEPTVTMNASAGTVARTPGEIVTVTFTRDGDLSSPLLVNYAMKGKAIAGTDYQMLPGHKKFKAGQSTITIKIKPLLGSLGRGTATAKVILQATEAYRVSGTSTIKVKIVDPKDH